RQRLAFGRQRSSPGHHHGFFGLIPKRAFGKHHQRESHSSQGPAVPHHRRGFSPGSSSGQHRPESHVSLRLHRKQVRVPHGPFLGFDRRTQHDSEYDCGRSFG